MIHSRIPSLRPVATVALPSPFCASLRRKNRFRASSRRAAWPTASHHRNRSSALPCLVRAPQRWRPALVDCLKSRSTPRHLAVEQGRPGGDRLTGAAAVHDTTAGCAGPHLSATADRDRSAGQDGGSLRRTASAGAPVDDASWRGPDYGAGDGGISRRCDALCRRQGGGQLRCDTVSVGLQLLSKRKDAYKIRCIRLLDTRLVLR